MKFRGMLAAAFASLLLEFLMTFTDTVVAGWLFGEKAIAGINLVSPVLQAMLAGIMSIQLGTAILHGSAMGRFDAERAARIFSCGFYASAGLGLLFCVLMLTAREPVLALYEADADTLVHARNYWIWYALTVTVAPIQVFLVNLVYADGDQRTCCFAYPVHFISNVAATLIACRWMGTGGCAAGTFVAHLLSIGVLALHFRRPSNSLRFRRYFSFRDVLLMMKASMGDACGILSLGIVAVVLNAFASARFGSDILPVTAVIAATTGMTVVFDGVSLAVQPLVEIYAGEGNTLRVRSLMRIAVRLIAALGLLASLALVLCPELMLTLVAVKDPAIVARASIAVRIVASSFVFWALVQLFNSYYLFIEHPKLSLLLTVTKDLVFPVVFLPAGGILFGETGMWTGYALAAPLGIGVFFLWMRMRYGKGLAPLMMPPERDRNIRVWDLVLTPERICEVSREIGEAAGTEAALLAEEVFMAILDRNRTRRKPVLAEATLDTNPPADGSAEDRLSLILRDDGEIFDITDADAQITSLRAHLVSAIMERQTHRRNLTTTGFNRNAFRFERSGSSERK